MVFLIISVILFTIIEIAMWNIVYKRMKHSLMWLFFSAIYGYSYFLISHILLDRIIK